MGVPGDGELRARLWGNSVDASFLSWAMLLVRKCCCSRYRDNPFFSTLFFRPSGKLLVCDASVTGPARSAASWRIGRIRSTMATEKGSVSGGPVRIESDCARCTATLTGRQLAIVRGGDLEQRYLLSISCLGKNVCRFPRQQCSFSRSMPLSEITTLHACAQIQTRMLHQ